MTPLNMYILVLQRNSLYRAVCFANFEEILAFSVPSIISADLLGHTCLLAWVQKVTVCDLWFVIGGFRSVLFVSGFKVRCFVIVLFWGNNRLVELALQVFLIFLIPVTCKNKATSASFLWQKIHSPSQFPLLIFLSSLGSFSAKLGEHVTLWLH